MTPAEISQYGAIVLALIAIAGHIKTWMSSGEKVLEDKVSALGAAADEADKKLTEHDRRIQTLENDLDHVPKAEMFHELALEVSEMRGDIKALTERLTSVAAVSNRLEQWLDEKRL